MSPVRSQPRQVDVLGVRIEQSTSEPVLLLREKESGGFLSIMVSPVEAVSLIHARNGVVPNYALADDSNYMLPHSLVCDVLGAADIQLLSAGIVRLRHGTFLAEINLSNGRTVSASPADSISLSLLTGAPVFVAGKVFEQTGIIIPEKYSNSTPNNTAGSDEQLRAAVPTHGPSDAPFPPLSAMRQMEVEGVRVETQTNKPVILLKEKQGSRHLPIWVSASEAAAVASQGERTAPRPPFTHDLFCHVLKAVGVQLLTVNIGKAGDRSYFCDLDLSNGIRVKTRAGDSLAFALRTGARVFVTGEFLDDAGMTPA